MNQKQQNAVQSPLASSPATDQPQGLPTQADGIAQLRSGHLEDAAAIFQQITAADPENWQSLHLLGLIAHNQGNYDEASDYILRCLTINPGLAEGYSDLAIILKHMGHYDSARQACEQAIALKPDFYPAYSNLGNVLKAQGLLEEAAQQYRKAIELESNSADAISNLGSLLLLLKQPEEALALCRKAVELAPNHGEATLGLAHALHSNNKLEDAIAMCRRAVELMPGKSSALSDLGCLLQEKGDFQEAISVHQRALAMSPGKPEVHNNYANTLKCLKRYGEALKHYRAAISLKPDYAQAYNNLGTVLEIEKDHRGAHESFLRAIELDPKLFAAHLNYACSLAERGKLPEAIACYEKALECEPDNFAAMVDYYHNLRHACDWKRTAELAPVILTNSYRKGKRVATFPILNINCEPEDHAISSRVWAKGLARTDKQNYSHGPLRSGSANGRLRIGYLSADFSAHATASLISELIERHDRSRFEIIGYCISNDDASVSRRRLMSAFDEFVELSDLANKEAADRIHEDRIDILIDLKGYTSEARTEILTCRPAPIQVNYLGYPGPMNGDFIDYVIADDFILPMDQQSIYDERIVHLPGCYQPNDSKRKIAPNRPSRTECGLPEKGFVFCCHNGNYKITPEIFGIWMRLLNAVPGSVLWLLEPHELTIANLRKEASAQGVDPNRLVFAPKLDLALHLARYRLADIFLDTLPVNAHTTASDALWAGLPVLTCAGNSFVARVCGSLLRAAGLPELITHSLADYEAAALRLAQNPAELRGLRDRLAQTRADAPLFDIERYRPGFEAALEHMAALHSAGQAPRPFAVADILKEAPPFRAAPAAVSNRIEPRSPAPVFAPVSAPEAIGESTTDPQLGDVIRLLSQSPEYKHFFLADLEWLVLPPVQHKQFHLFRDGARITGVALWAYVSDEVEQRLQGGSRRLAPQDWHSGNKLWLVDVVAPYGGQAAMSKELRERIIPGARI